MPQKTNPRPVASGAGLKNTRPRQFSTPAELFASRVEGTRRCGRDQYISKCTAHEDGRPSLSWREWPNGALAVHCFAGCSAAEVMAGAGLTLADMFPVDHRNGDYNRRPIPARQRWDWHGLLQLLRYESEIVLQCAHVQATQQRLSQADYVRLRKAKQRIERVVGLSDG